MFRYARYGGGSHTMVQPRVVAPVVAPVVEPVVAPVVAQGVVDIVDVAPNVSEKARKKKKSKCTAVDRDGQFDLQFDTRTASGHAVFIAHAHRGHELDIHANDTIHVISAQGHSVSLPVSFVTPHKYVRPGSKNAYCRVGVDLQQCSQLSTTSSI